MYIRFESVAHRSTTMMAIFVLHFYFLLLDTQAASAEFDLWWFYLFLGGWVMKRKVWVGRNYREFLCARNFFSTRECLSRERGLKNPPKPEDLKVSVRNRGPWYFYFVATWKAWQKITAY